MKPWLKRVAGAGTLTALAFVVVQGARAARAEARSFHPRRGPVVRPACLADLAVRDVEFTACGAKIRGWYVPSSNGAAIVLAHGSEADRSQMAFEARALADAGFGSLAFDWPGHGESGGVVTLGVCERQTLSAATSVLAGQPEVDGRRIGALGVSTGAALVAVAAPTDDRLRALVLVSPFTDSDDLTRAQYARWGPITQWPALWVDHAHMSDGPLRPAEAVTSLGVRSLLVIAGAADEIVPPAMSEEVHRVARAREKELWIVPGAGHVGVPRVAGEQYASRLARFFRSSLLSP